MTVASILKAVVLTAIVVATGAQPAFGQVLKLPSEADALSDIDSRFETDPSITFRDYGPEQGLPQTSVHSIVFDAAGFMWGSTFGGLFTFDGVEVRGFEISSQPFLVASPPSAMARSADGSLWVGRLGGGIARFRNAQYLDSLPSHPRPFTAVTGLLEAPDSTLWVLIDNQPMAYRRGQWYSSSAQTLARRRSSFIIDGRGEAMVAGADGVLRLKIPDQGTELSIEVVVPGQSSDLHRDREGWLWIASATGVRALVPEHGMIEVPGITDVEFQQILEDAEGRIWAFGDVGLIIDADRNARQFQVSRIPTDQVNEYLSVANVSLTPDGVVVAGMMGGGLRVFRRSFFERWGYQTGASMVEARAMVADGAGGLYVGSQCEGVLQLDSAGSQIAQLWPDSACAHALIRDRRGRLWLGDIHRVRRWDPQTERYDVWTLGNGSVGAFDVLPLLELPGDTILFGVADGRVGMIDPDDRLQFSDHYGNILDSPLWSMEFGLDATRWFGGIGEVAHLTADGSFRRFGQEQGIPEGQIRVIEPTSDGGAWIGSYGGGLARLRPDGSVIAVTLRDETVQALAPLASGGMWVLQNSGLTWLDQGAVSRIEQGLGSDLRAVSYGIPEGVAEGNSGRPSVVALDSRRLAFATVDGVVIVPSAEVPVEPRAPLPVIDRVLLGSAREALVFPLQVVVQPDERFLRVHVSTPKFLFPGTLDLRYMLVGRDGNWIDVAADGWIEMAAMDPGQYRLDIEAAVGSGQWVATRPLEVMVVPAWTEWVWLRTLAVLAVLALAANFIRLRLLVSRQREEAARAESLLLERAARQRERHQRELARVGQIATAGELSASLIHELGQPLGAIVNDTASARVALSRLETEEPEQVDELSGILADIASSGQRVSRIISDLRGFFKEGASLAEQVQLNDVVRDATGLATTLRDRISLEIEHDLDGALPAIAGDRALLLQVLMILINNVAEADNGSQVRKACIRSRTKGNAVSISVADRGPGIPKPLNGQLFEPFFTTKERGMGMGLAIARRIVEAHGGWVSGRNRPTGGAVFRITIPWSDDLSREQP